jgi:hypothetical protein
MQPNTSLTRGPASAKREVPEAASIDSIYLIFGIALAAGISAAFWVGALALMLPLFGVIPSKLALAAAAIAVSGFVATIMVALNVEQP